VVVAGAAHAAPGGDATIKTADFTTGDGMGGGIQAQCPLGQRAMGGGIGTLGGTGFSVIQVTGPLDETGLTVNTVPGDAAAYWYSNGYTFSSSGLNERQWRTFALCSPTSDATVATQTLSLDANASGGLAVTCPDGTRAVGGGVGTTAATVGSAVKRSGPVDETGVPGNTITGDVPRGWVGHVRNTDSPRDYKVFALCSAASDATVVAVDTPTPTTTSITGAPAVCPAGQRVTGGGFGALAGPATGEVRIDTPLDSTGVTANTVDGDVAVQWNVQIQNASQNDTYRVFAICVTDGVGSSGGGGGGPGGGQPTPPAPVTPPPNDIVSPVITALRISPTVFGAARSGGSIAISVGARVSYTLSEAATMGFRVKRAAAGRRVGRLCVRPIRANVRKPRCTRYLALAGAFSRPGAQGANSFRFTGRLRSRRLAPGRYRLSAVADDGAGNRSREALAGFTIR
jgi:hypothetical protein